MDGCLLQTTGLQIREAEIRNHTAGLCFYAPIAALHGVLGFIKVSFGVFLLLDAVYPVGFLLGKVVDSFLPP